MGRRFHGIEVSLFLPTLWRLRSGLRNAGAHVSDVGLP
jgi:hypothetical protein